MHRLSFMVGRLFILFSNREISDISCSIFNISINIKNQKVDIFSSSMEFTTINILFQCNMDFLYFKIFKKANATFDRNAYLFSFLITIFYQALTRAFTPKEIDIKECKF